MQTSPPSRLGSSLSFSSFLSESTSRQHSLTSKQTYFSLIPPQLCHTRQERMRESSVASTFGDTITPAIAHIKQIEGQKRKRRMQDRQLPKGIQASHRTSHLSKDHHHARSSSHQVPRVLNFKYLRVPNRYISLRIGRESRDTSFRSEMCRGDDPRYGSRL